jgi:uncharacterized protein YjiS (DUF1127 family)
MTMAARTITSQDINALTGRNYPGLGSGVPALLTLLRRLASWHERNRAYRETVSELGRLSDHLLADVGIGRHEIGAIARTLSRRAG